MVIGRAKAGKVTYLTPSQPLLEAEVPALRQALEECLAAAETRIVIDLHGVAAMDSRGLEFLLEARDAVDAHGGALQLANPNPLVHEILAATRLDREIEITFDLERAGRSLRS